MSPNGTSGKPASSGKFKLLIISLAVLIVGGLAFALLYPKANTAQEHISRAQTHYANHKIKATIIELKNALSVDARSVDARRLLGEIYLDQGIGESAEKELKYAIGLSRDVNALLIQLAEAQILQKKFKLALETLARPEFHDSKEEAQALALSGDIYLEKRKRDTAAKYYISAINLNPDQLEANVGQAKLLLQDNKMAAAKAILIAFKQHSPHAPELWQLLGGIYVHEQSPILAEKAFDQALKINNFQYISRFKRGITRASLGNFEGAKSDAIRLKKQLRKHPSSSYILGFIAYRQQKFNDAIEQFNITVSHNPNFELVRYYLGTSYLMVGNYAQAENYLARFHQKHPKSLEVKQLLAAIALSKGKANESMKLIEPIIKGGNANLFTLKILAESLIQSRRFEEADKIVDRIIDEQPEEAKGYTLKGNLLIAKGEVESAVVQYETALALSPDNKHIENRLIDLLIQQQQFKKALALINNIRERDPDSERPFNLLGTSYSRMGNYEMAKKAFESAQTMNPVDPVSTHSLALLAIRTGNIKQAKTYYLNLLKRDPDNAITQMHLAEFAFSRGNLDEANTVLSTFITKTKNKTPNHTSLLPAQLLLARTQTRQRRATDAINTLNKIDKKYINTPLVQLTLAEAQLAAKQTATALKTLNTVITLKPNARAELLKARVHMAENKHRQALIDLNKAITLSPKNPEILALLVEVHLTLDNRQDANRYLTTLQTIAPSQTNTKLTQVAYYNHIKAHDKAIIILEKLAQQQATERVGLSLIKSLIAHSGTQVGIERASRWLESHPDHYRIHHLLGDISYSNNDRATTIKHYLTALKGFPNHPLLLNNLAYFYLDNDLDKALGFATRAKKVAPSSNDVLDTYGWIQYLKGDYETALANLRQAEVNGTENSTIHYHLAATIAKLGDRQAAAQKLRGLLRNPEAFPEKSQAQQLLKELN